MEEEKKEGTRRQEGEEIGGINASESNSVAQYLKYYSKLANQQNMLQDAVRTGHYYQAITNNKNDFANKVVMDIGAGSGILSLFAAMAGAKKVYAVEASEIAVAAQTLITANNYGNIIEVIHSKLEDIDRPELEKSVDIFVSESLGTMLFNERMLETYIIARDRFLKPEGKMFPSSANLCMVPFYDEVLFKEQSNKVAFWNSTNFYGLNLTCLKEKAKAEKFAQPIIEIYDPNTHLANEEKREVDFTTITLAELQEINYNLTFEITNVGIIHGIACWFEAIFHGSQSLLVLNTGPRTPATHWYQMRFLLPKPIAVNPSQKVDFNLYMKTNDQQSYDITFKLYLADLNLMSSANYDLKDPEYRGYYSQQYNNANYGSQYATSPTNTATQYPNNNMYYNWHNTLPI